MKGLMIKTTPLGSLRVWGFMGNQFRLKELQGLVNGLHARPRRKLTLSQSLPTSQRYHTRLLLRPKQHLYPTYEHSQQGYSAKCLYQYSQVRLYLGPAQVSLEGFTPTIMVVPQHPCKLCKLFFAVRNGFRLACPEARAQFCVDLVQRQRE